MPRVHTCPTCATVLGPLHAAHLRRCNACNRQNPHQFNYCGFCASPLENTQMRAKLAEIAAPPGGWPSLTAELIQLRFFLEQGQIEDAFELSSILQKRHPGHPSLTDFARRAEPGKTDVEVGELVESLLAASPGLCAKVLRRAAPRWDAPQVVGSVRTSVYEAVEAEPTQVSAHQLTQVHTPTPPGESTSVDTALATRGKHTVVVEALQPAAPFVGSEDDEIPPPQQSIPAEERMNAGVHAAGEIDSREETPREPTKKRGRKSRPARPRRGGTAFGQHVLTRLGG
jgi:hypothetical protein